MLLSRKQKALIGVVVGFVVLIIAYFVMGRLVPTHITTMRVGSKAIFYQETSRLIQCDVAYTEVVVHEDETYEYAYQLINIGNGSCYSDLYVWSRFQYYRLPEAIDEGIVSLNDFLESDVVIQRPITTGE